MPETSTPSPQPTRTPSLTTWDQIDPEPMNPLLTRQFVAGSQAMLARIVLKKGCTVPEHSHANEQISYILSGALEFTFGDDTKIVRAGGVLVIPPTVPHAAFALEDTVNLDVFSPPRQDWLDGSDAYLR